MKTMKTDLFTTLRECCDFVHSNSDGGCLCPCCLQRVKVYKWKLSNQLCVFLLWLEKNHGTGYYRDFINQYPVYISKVYSMARHWGLIMQTKPGYWTLTLKGERFINRVITVPKYVFILDNTAIGFSTEEVEFDTAIRLKFDLKETLN